MQIQRIEWDKIPKKLIFRQDCTKTAAAGNYFEIGESKIVHADCGIYREAAYVNDSRFGYRFRLSDKTKPHLLVIHYPDDKDRFMCIQNGTSYDSTTGVMTGGEWEITHEMQTIYLPYWPRWADDSIVFSSYGVPCENPAAVASFEVYEMEYLPEIELPQECKKEENRTIGIQYEDPGNVGAAEGALDFYTWLSHHIDFMKMTGQNKLNYPINWYHGPVIPVESQPHSRFNTLISEDRKFYTRSTYDTPDWLEFLLKRFDEEKLRFTGTLTLLRLGNLMTAQNIDIDSIKAGEDTINNVLYNGMVQTSINDWTIEHNPKNFPEIVKNEGKWLKRYAYGEEKTTDVATPIFNPLHPKVQEQVITYFTEIAEKYSSHPSFEGLSVNFWHGTFLWYGNLLAGYDDHSFGLFEKEKRVVSGIEKADPDRFAKRYEWMLKNCKEEFVQWRCEKIHEFLTKLKDALQKVRSDLKLGIHIWNETSHFGYFPEKGHIKDMKGAKVTYGNRFSNIELYRQGGLDLRLFQEDKGFELCVEHNSARDRSKWCVNGKENLEAGHKFRDFAYLDDEMNEVLRNSIGSVGFHFDSWIELWGNYRKFACDPNDPNIPMIKNLPDFKADYIFRENASYADDPDGKFFFDGQLRICAPYPSGVYFMEELTMDIALRDALSLTTGGLYLDKSHVVEKAELAREYRKLPKVPFTELKAEGPVVVRWYYDGRISYIYAVNREPYELPVRIEGEDFEIEECIAPFMLKVWVIEKKMIPLRAKGYVANEIKEKYQKEAACVYELFRKVDMTKDWTGGVGLIEEKMKKAEAEENYADLRHLLHSYVVCKAKKVFYDMERKYI